MKIRRIAIFVAVLATFCAAGGFGWHALTSLTTVRAQQSATTPAPPSLGAAAQAPTQAIKTETREVRVDVVVTDKKGDYVTDLTQKDFKVYEDNKEQSIINFLFGADPAGPVRNQRHYLDRKSVV